MKFTKYTGIIVLLVLFTACSKNDSERVNLLPDSGEKADQIRNKSNAFGLSLFKRLNAQKQANQNVVISPLSTSMVLGMAYNGVGNETRDKFAEILGWDQVSLRELNLYNKRLINHLHQESQNIQMNISNSVWFNKRLSVNFDFLKRNRENFQAFSSAIDGDQSTSRLINRWVAQSTNNKIKKVIDEVSASDMLYILNATYFKGNWKNDFNESKTKESKFHLEDGTTKPVRMMWQKADLKYFDGDRFQLVELPYENESYCMYILLPDDDVKLDQLIGTLDYESWHKNKNKLSLKRNINFGMPRFHCEHAIKMQDLLAGMGLENLFYDRNNDLSGITDNQVAISEMMHKAAIDVDEKGTEASAATSVARSFTTLVEDDPFSLIVNRPFVFAIEEKRSNTLLFIGKISKP